MTNSEWQSIGTAPKDGTRVMLWWMDSPEVGYYVGEDVRGKYGELQVAAGWHLQNGNMYRDDPSHWMPLPAPPEQTREEKGQVR